MKGMRCWAEIDLAALERNLALIRKSLPAGVRLISVVKADAYGHGIHHTATRLMQAGADVDYTILKLVGILQFEPCTHARGQDLVYSTISK